jgi:hypothetical protein
LRAQQRFHRGLERAFIEVFIELLRAEERRGFIEVLRGEQSGTYSPETSRVVELVFSVTTML